MIAAMAKPPGSSTDVARVRRTSTRQADLIGRAVAVDGMPGTLFDAQEYVRRRFGLKPTDTLRVFHQTRTAWAKPGQRVKIEARPDPYSAFGNGFYTSQRAALNYGSQQLQVEVPV